MTRTMRLASRHRFVVLVLGLVLTAGTVVYLQVSPGVYWARTRVALLAPPSTVNPNIIQTTSGSLIATAGIVARRVNGEADELLPVSPDVTLADQGVRNGSRVYQPNTGGQWATNFETAQLIVDVVAPTAEEVRARTATLVGEIQEVVADIQTEVRADEFSIITARPATPTPVIVYDTGHTRVAQLLTLVLGIALSLGAYLRLGGRPSPQDGRGSGRRGEVDAPDDRIPSLV